MLQSLIIQNYALIEYLSIDLSKGMSVITGETGAGKSILLGALSLILGQRADARHLKNDTQKCVIEGGFDLSQYDLNEYFTRNEIDYDEHHTILRRELLPNGKSRAFVNDCPVSLQVMKELGSRMIDIHSQHQNMLLSEEAFQLRIVDILSNSTPLFDEYKVVHKDWQRVKSELKSMDEERRQAVRDEEYLRFQLQQLEDAQIEIGELNELEEEQARLTHAEEIKGTLFRLVSLFDGDEGGVLASLKEGVAGMESLSRKVVGYEDIYERLSSNYIDLKDVFSECSRKLDSIELNEDRLEEVNARISMIYELMQKHKVSDEVALVAFRDSIASKLELLTNFDDRIEEKKNEIVMLERTMRERGGLLSVQRKSAASEIEEQWMQMVSQLGMPNVRIKIEFVEAEGFGDSGLESVQLLFAANKNGQLLPVGETASGGEIGRMMLVVKYLIAGKMALPTIIFDEIDTGVSGEIASKMGAIMQDMGKEMQVICITHLAQIAGMGASHYKVFKEDGELTTTTNIRQLNADERVRELASMISGAEITEAALEHARTMLSNR